MVKWTESSWRKLSISTCITCSRISEPSLVTKASKLIPCWLIEINFRFLDMATLARKIYPIDFSHLVAFDKRLFEIYCDQVRNNQEICLTGTIANPGLNPTGLFRIWSNSAQNSHVWEWIRTCVRTAAATPSDFTIQSRLSSTWWLPCSQTLKWHTARPQREFTQQLARLETK